MNEDEGTEAEYLESRGDYEEDIEDMRSVAAETRQKMKSLYDIAKAAALNSEIRCPGCGQRHFKETYQKVFCRNKGKDNCKDHYWNTVDEVRSIKAGGAHLW